MIGWFESVDIARPTGDVHNAVLGFRITSPVPAPLRPIARRLLNLGIRRCTAPIPGTS